MDPTERLALLPDPLLRWYQQSARVLPWRSNPVPYWVWVSEIMLQQTRVEAAIPYFERFIHTLPTIEDLACAEEPLLLKLWEGLGYYNRVRNMKKAALLVMQEYGGVLPDDPVLLQKLPGIGAYTAGAICSIAYEKPVPAVDGNVLRVVSRMLGLSEDVSKQTVKKQVGAWLEEIFPPHHAGDFTQALMELGATVCLPHGEPLCAACPAREFCVGHAQGNPVQYPVLPPKKERKIEYKTVFLIRYGECVALHQRGADGLLAHMWEFPNTEGAFSLNQAKNWLQAQGLAVCSILPAGKARHIFTHIQWEMTGFAVEISSDVLPDGWLLVTQEAIQ